jgi:hypothetical protein
MRNANSVHDKIAKDMGIIGAGNVQRVSELHSYARCYIVLSFQKNVYLFCINLLCVAIQIMLNRK